MNASYKTNQASRIVALIAAVVTSSALFSAVVSLADQPVNGSPVAVVAYADAQTAQR